jgi:hypothetical protein
MCCTARVRVGSTTGEMSLQTVNLWFMLALIRQAILNNDVNRRSNIKHEQLGVSLQAMVMHWHQLRC